MRKHDTSRRLLSVCLSVCPAQYTLVYCIRTDKDIIELFSRPGSPIILVFEPKRLYTIPSEPLSTILGVLWYIHSH